jgi:hypothetical protein
VFGLLANQGVLGVRDGALVVLLDGGGSGDGGVEDPPNKLADVDFLLGGVLFSLASGLSDACMLLGL